VLLGLLFMGQREIGAVGNGIVIAINAKTLLPEPVVLLSQAGERERNLALAFPRTTGTKQVRQMRDILGHYKRSAVPVQARSSAFPKQ